MRVHRTLLRALAIGAIAVATMVPGSLASADPTPQQVASQIEKATNELEDVVESYNAVGESLKQNEAKAAEVGQRVTELRGQLDSAYKGVQSLASAAFRGGGEMSALTALLVAGSTDRIVDQVATLKYINRSKQREISSYLELKTKLDGEGKRLDGLVTEQKSQQRQLADRKTKIETNLRDLEALKRRVNAPPPAAGDDPGPPPNVSGSAGAAVSFAYAQLGKPYVYGATGPGSYDCSGLTMRAWAQAGVSLPHNAAQQWNKVAHVARGSIQPGDLVFYRGLGHVGIFVGNGKVIHAPQPGDVVKAASVDMMPPYGYGRPR